MNRKFLISFVNILTESKKQRGYCGEGKNGYQTRLGTKFMETSEYGEKLCGDRDNIWSHTHNFQNFSASVHFGAFSATQCQLLQFLLLQYEP